MLWLSLFLPYLPLEVYSRGDAGSEPLAVCEGRGNRQWVSACNSPAWDMGVRPGMRLSAAQALAHGLRVRMRHQQAEAAALANIAAWAGQFTPVVSLEPPQALLLEVQGSLALFGGVAALLRQIRQGMAALGYRAAMAMAPPPAAALLLARAGREVWVQDTGALVDELGKVSLDFLDVPPATRAALRGLGLRQLREMLDLPRDGLTRRYGPELVIYLDRLTGRQADPRRHFAMPQRFHSRLELPAEVENAAALLFAARRLLLELCGFLRSCCGGTQQLYWELLHRDHESTRFTVGMVSPNRDAEHLTGLLRERLDRVQLPEPVQEITLTVEEILPLPGETHALLKDPSKCSEDWPQLVERLGARLGEEAVQGICSVAEHRPERAWRPCAPGESWPCARFGARPLWLLSKPRPLEIKGCRPVNGGVLSLLQGPERIESGWWDGSDVLRDYYIAENPQGERYWIFRERREEGGWYVHGVFG